MPTVPEPGGYGFIDFVKIGVAMAPVTGVVSLVLIPLPFDAMKLS